MKLESLQKKLLAAARANPPSDHVPPAFEQRILAHLQSQPAVDVAALWARSLWRAVIPCVAVALVMAGVAIAFVPTESTAATESDLSQVFEQTLLASNTATQSSGEELWGTP